MQSAFIVAADLLAHRAMAAAARGVPGDEFETHAPVDNAAWPPADALTQSIPVQLHDAADEFLDRLLGLGLDQGELRRAAVAEVDGPLRR